MGSQDPVTEMPLGVAAFGNLRAEDEPWLAECFVPPEDFGLMSEMRSIAVFGASGSGKSAVREMLIRQNCAPSGGQRCLVADWQLVLAAFESPDAFRSVPGQVACVFDACGMAILEHIARVPVVWTRASEWARRMFTWFIHRFVQGDLETRCGPLLTQYPEAGAEAIRDFLGTDWDPGLMPAHNWPLVAAELSKALNQQGVDGIWVVVDGLEPWMQAQFDLVVSALGAFFSTLPLFEKASIAYKTFLPAAAEPALAASTGVGRHRVQRYRLEWRGDQLIEIVERRLACAAGGRALRMTDLCAAPGFLEWVKRNGGSNPRAWLELVRPVVVHYFAQQPAHPIPEETWKELRRQSPPRLFVDRENARVIVGGREVPVKEMTRGGYRLLCYLYRNAGRLVPWPELYYRGYRGLSAVPLSKEDKGYEYPEDWEPVLQTRMSDLRKAIEPDPQEPVYLETVKGEGVVLKLSW